MRGRWMPEFMLQGLAILPRGWLWVLVFNLLLFAYLILQAEPVAAIARLLLLLLVGMTLRLLALLGKAEKQQLDLQMRLAASLRRLQQAEEAIRMAEQKRYVFHELHEELGSTLLSIAHAGRNTRPGNLASTALGNLRDAVARANRSEIRFGSFLRRLREEMTLRLSGLDITLHWEQPAHFAEWTMGLRQHYLLSRIFRELVSNVIRHAHASRVAFSVAGVTSGWSFSLADNGAGFDIAMPAGAGIVAVKAWAAELGADIQWDAKPEAGVLFTLLLRAPSLPAKNVS